MNAYKIVTHPIPYFSLLFLQVFWAALQKCRCCALILHMTG